MTLQEKIAAAREQAEMQRNVIRWIPTEEGEELVGAFLDEVTYETPTKRYKSLTFLRFKAVAGDSESFTKNKKPHQLQEGDIVEVPAHGLLNYLRKNQSWAPGDLILLQYGGKNPYTYEGDNGEVEESDAHGWAAVRLDD